MLCVVVAVFVDVFGPTAGLAVLVGFEGFLLMGVSSLKN